MPPSSAPSSPELVYVIVIAWRPPAAAEDEESAWVFREEAAARAKYKELARAASEALEGDVRVHVRLYRVQVT